MRYFFYGTLRDAEVRDAVLGLWAARLTARDATLPGYQTVYFPGYTYPALVPAADAVAAGVLIEGVPPVLRRRLRRFEGDQYVERELVVGSGSDRLTARLFMPRVPPRTSRAWSFATWRRRHKRGFLAALLPGGTAVRPARQIENRRAARRGGAG